MFVLGFGRFGAASVTCETLICKDLTDGLIFKQERGRKDLVSSSLCTLPLSDRVIFSHLFIVHSNSTSSLHSVCSHSANNQQILYLYSLFIYIANEVAQGVRYG